ncbi:AsmA family protein [Novacetimonas pomaceti]|uniref:AsmA family protein n=1 Tax=Novacetimonas pomaceti TaxID=2021998 RepID=UPI001C2DBFEB|nr:AsmA family protein [Novacetimonas pomaceti]MBV1835003.1 AsmA family protein [Novacetimonas pomaceti]
MTDTGKALTRRNDPPPPRQGRAVPPVRAIVAGAICVAVLVLVILWSWDWFIPLVERRAGAALHRRVTIAHLHVRPGRVIVIGADDVRIDQPEGFGNLPPLATAKRLDVAIRWWPLLWGGGLDLPLISLDTPVVELQERADGSRNYDFSDPNAPKEDRAPKKGDASMPRIGAVRIVGGQLHVMHARLHTDMRGQVHTTEASDPEGARLVMDARGTYVRQAITGHFSGGTLVSLQDRRQPYPVDLEVRHGETRLALHGAVEDPLSLAGARLRLSLAGPDMSLLYPLTGVVIPQTPPYRVEGNLDYTAAHVRFRDLDGHVGSSDLGGDLSIDPHQTVPFVDAELHSRRVDLADLGGFFGATPGEKPSTAQQQEEARAHASSNAVLPSTPINMPKIRATNVHFAYHGDHIENRHTPLDNIDVLADIRDGVIDVHHLNFAVGSGTLASSGTFTPRGDAVEARIGIDMVRINLSRLMQATGRFHGNGVFGGHLAVHGTGNSLAAIVGNGDGGMTVALDQGGDISAVLPDLLGLELGKALLSLLGLPGETELKCVIADMPLRQGILGTRTLLIETGDTRTVGKGDINFRDNTIDYALMTDSRHFAVGSFPGTLHITGLLKKPSIMPGTETIARAVGSVLLGVVTPVALLPTIEAGVGKESLCAQAIRQMRDNPASGQVPVAGRPQRVSHHQARAAHRAHAAHAPHPAPTGRLSAAERARIRQVWTQRMKGQHS